MAAPKKVIDPWKTKKWYVVIAPNFLNNAKAGEVAAQDDESLLNRIISIPLREITRDLNHLYTGISLRIAEIDGKKAYAKFIGHSVAREYLRTLVRRRREVVDAVFPAKSSDGVEFVIKVMCVTANRCSTRQKYALRKAMIAGLTEKAAGQDFGSFVRDVLFGKASGDMQKSLNKIVPVRRVEVWRTQLKEEFDTEDKQALPDARAERAAAEKAEPAAQAPVAEEGEGAEPNAEAA